MLEVSIFCLLNSLNQETSKKINELLLYNFYHEWMKHLKKEIDFVQVLTTFLLNLFVFILILYFIDIFFLIIKLSFLILLLLDIFVLTICFAINSSLLLYKVLLNKKHTKLLFLNF